jgi:hypothetical protein
MNRPVSGPTELALRAAMHRLLAGCPKATDGRLTIVNLAIEAGVSRATANRGGQVLIDFRSAIVDARTQRPATDQIAPSVNEDRERRAIENLLAQHMQARALHQRHEERRATRAALVPITSPRRP